MKLKIRFKKVSIEKGSIFDNAIIIMMMMIIQNL